MSQQGVYELLKKRGTWMTTKEIAKVLKINPGSALRGLNKCLYYGEVCKQRIIKSGGKEYLWKAVL